MTENKFSGYFDYYISKVDHKPLIGLLTEQQNALFAFFKSIPTSAHNYAYDEGKWTVKEVVFHIIETEIIMLYRAIRVSRGDSTPLPGYDENMMIEKARISEMSFENILELFENSRKNTLFYFKHFSEEELNRSGTFSNLKLDAKGLGYLLAGHAEHHIEVLKERYFPIN